MSDPSFALQVALFARLEAEVSCPVFDGAPMDQPMPYVSLDSEVSIPSDILSKRRDTRLIYLSVWSRFRGQEEVKRIMAEIDAAVHQRPLPLETGRVISIRVDRKQALRENDGETYQGSVTLRVLTEH
ncbi:DUF3168 domain-containing protein [Pseudomonas plecoglossicida]|uniref:DUF3168 domain-containing protein n=1 Tax=Pseudomonas plecoglossicida TaxID=70775 RepID=UPI00051E05DF|nr:DUF3168 domain-containing protein [Pseudomonas plecoglossicida]KGK24793.1 hypothetical protein GT93_08060 [Pseudomonas plecoglossicida]